MIKRISKKGLVLSLLLLTLVLLVSVSSAQEAESDRALGLDGGKPALQPATATAVSARTGNVVEPKDVGNEEAIYLIRLESAPLATYTGGIKGLTATSPLATGAQKLDVESVASQAYSQHLVSEQAQFMTRMDDVLGRKTEIVYQYIAGNNAVAAKMTSEEAARIAALPGVTFVQRDEVRELHTDAGPTWIGAPGIWDGSATGGLPGTKGEGIVVGVIDTGINPSNPSFAEVGPVDGYVHTNPKGQYFGVCDPLDASYDPTFPCNDKLIGAWGFPTVNGGDPRDNDGHGSHTASTSAGNEVVATIDAPTLTINPTISGVAPHANIIAYAGCCTLSALTGSIDQAILDGVDAINYSIGSSSPSNPWTDFDAVGFLNARAAGIFVATSAGNDGPDPSTLGSPADVPWLTSVAATTHNRIYFNYLTDMVGGDTTPPADITGKGFTSGYGPAPIIYAGDLEATYPGAALCGTGPSADPPDGSSNPFPPGTFNGEIVVCDRGTYGRVEKGLNVMLAGAGGYILANNEASGDSLVGDAHFLPAVHITYDDGVVLKAWLASGAGHTASIAGAVANSDAANGDVMASFSSRGPNRALPDMLGPFVAAPGVDIIAAYGTGDSVEWGFLSGTSMASPHVAGAGALMAALHPDWTPAEIQSALMTTAVTAVLKEDGVTPADPFDIGSGRID